jgi:hypothetical protein
MKRIIINFGDDVKPEDALVLVYGVVKDGRISNNGKNYCYVTEFSGGEFKSPHDVYAKRNSNVSDTFDVRQALEAENG